MPNNPSNANSSTKSIVEELESITSLLDEIEGDCAKLIDNNSEQEIPILSHIIEGSNTVTTKADNMMVAQSLFPTNDEMIEQVIPTLTQSLTAAKPKADEEQLILPPVEELDAELAQSQPPTEPIPLVTSQQIEDAVKQCMAELEPIVREKITKILAANNS
ncbi:MAG: hemerythrin superfamily protein [Pseudomonadales bacterium]